MRFRPPCLAKSSWRLTAPESSPGIVGIAECSLTDEEPPPLPNRLGRELAIDLRSPSRSVGSISTGALNETSRRRLPRSRLPTITLLGQRGASTAVREIQVKESQEIPPSQVPTMGTSRGDFERSRVDALSPMVVISPRLWSRRGLTARHYRNWRRVDKKRKIARKRRNIFRRIR